MIFAVVAGVAAFAIQNNPELKKTIMDAIVPPDPRDDYLLYLKEY